MATEGDRKQITVRRFIELLQALPPAAMDAPIAYVDFNGWDDVEVYFNEKNGVVEVGPK